MYTYFLALKGILLPSIVGVYLLNRRGQLRFTAVATHIKQTRHSVVGQKPGYQLLSQPTYSGCHLMANLVDAGNESIPAGRFISCQLNSTLSAIHFILKPRNTVDF